MRETRSGRAGDVPALIEIFWRGVHEGAAPRYTTAQRRAWLPIRPTVSGFAERLATQSVVVAEENGAATGFMSLTDAGYLDLAFVLPHARGSGTADAMLAVLLNRGVLSGLLGLTTRASDMARPFFVRHHWRVLKSALQTRDDIVISATDMAFSL